MHPLCRVQVFLLFGMLVLLHSSNQILLDAAASFACLMWIGI